MSTEERPNGSNAAHPGFLRLKYFFIIIFIFTIVPFAAVGLNDLYRNILEHNPPIIQLIDVPRGVGLSPVNVKFRVSDTGSGLDQVVVRLKQRGPSKEIQKVDAYGKNSVEVSVDLDSESHNLVEGSVNIDVRAFDKSFWSNRAEMNLPLRVDFRRPKIEVLSTQHNAREGGSQMVFYKAFDEDLALSGVKVDNQIFMGYPATSIDKDLDDRDLKVALYAVPLSAGTEGSVNIRLFAEDKVGNATSANFYNKIAARTLGTTKVTLQSEFLRDKIVDLASKARTKIRSSEAAPADPDQRLIADFVLVNEKLRILNETELASLVSKSPRHETFWKGPFVRQSVSIQQTFGEMQNFVYEGKTIGSARSWGEEWVLPRGQNEVLATNDGIVIFVQDLGTYGWTVGIDHGLGLVSIYSRLGNASIQNGTVVEKGQAIGVAGSSGFARNQHVYFEMRLQGVPVDPREWFDANWFYSHIVGKTNDIKKMFGIPVYLPLR